MKRRRTEDDYDRLKDEGMLGEMCLCTEDEEGNLVGWMGCPLHDPLYHERKRKKEK